MPLPILHSTVPNPEFYGPESRTLPIGAKSNATLIIYLLDYQHSTNYLTSYQQPFTRTQRPLARIDIRMVLVQRPNNTRKAQTAMHQHDQHDQHQHKSSIREKKMITKTSRDVLPKKTSLAVVLVILLAICMLALKYDDNAQGRNPPEFVQHLAKKKMNTNSPSAAVFLQVGYAELWSEMLMCTTNVVTAAALKNYQQVDLYVSIIAGVQHASLPRQETLRNYKKNILPRIQTDLKNIPHVGNIFIKMFDNEGADIKPFMEMLAFQTKSVDGSSYDAILKMHTKGDNAWRERAIESLCGTPEQVISILNHFQSDSELDMIVPQGTAFGHIRNKTDIFPHIVRKYELTSIVRENDGNEEEDPVFDKGTETTMNKLHKMMFPNGIPDMMDADEDFGVNKMMIAAGTMFWIRYPALHPQELTDLLPKLTYTKGYVENLGVEHSLERLFATEIALRNRRIAEIPPAPRPLALYFPQYHSIPENDRFWGKDFTEWTLLKPLEIKGIRKPLSEKKGGLGYYNLLSKDVRRKQADIAKKYGVNGFIMYHYWFSGEQAPKDHLVMQQVQEQMLLDGEPNLPFAFSWANEPWSKRWTGGAAKNDEQLLLSQEYGDEDEWREHFEYLLKFFNHENYIRVNDKPLFSILYRIGHIGSKLEPMLALWRKLAVEAGLPGIHIVNTIGNFRQTDKDTVKIEKGARLDAAFHFWPQLMGSGYTNDKMGSDAASANDLKDLVDTYPTQYWGSFTGFDRRPRDKTAAPILSSVNAFKSGLECSFEGMANIPDREIAKNFYFITAWNEWNEQAVLEPDTIHKFGYLETLSTKLQEVPVSIVFPESDHKKNAGNRGEFLSQCKKKRRE